MKTVKMILPLLLCFAVVCGCGKKAPATGKIVFSGHPALEVVYNGKTFKGDPITLKTRPGTYNFRIGAPGHYPRFAVVSVKAGRTTQVKVELEPVVSAVLIDSEPQGAKVKFRGEIRGSTPLVISDLPAGEYSAQIICPGYAEEQLAWRIVSERLHPRVFARLRMTSGRMIIKTIPEGARVFINGQLSGVSPFSASLEAGIHKVRVEREGFNPLEQNVTVKSGKTGTLTLRLDTRPGALKIASDPQGAEVFIDDKKMGVTPFVMEAIHPGNYQIRLVHQGYDDLLRVVSVAPGREESIRLQLDKSTGSAGFRIRPAGVSYLIDGKFIGKVRGVAGSVTETQLTVVENLAPGKHVLTVTHPRAKPLRKDIRFAVSKGKRYVSKENIDLWVANCEITFKDGRVESGMVLSESEADVYYSPAAGIKYPVSRSYIRSIKHIPLVDK